MEYFYIADDANLIELASFQIIQGRSPIVPVHTFGGVQYMSGRRSPDRFALVAADPIPSGGQFRVVDENATVYECLGERVHVVNGQLSVSGIICAQWEPEQKDAALEAIRFAKGKGHSQ